MVEPGAIKLVANLVLKVTSLRVLEDPVETCCLLQSTTLESCLSTQVLWGYVVQQSRDCMPVCVGRRFFLLVKLICLFCACVNSFWTADHAI